MIRHFLMKANKAVTSPELVNPKDLPGSSGRLDLVCRAINAALLLSHGIRKNAFFHVILEGPSRPPVYVRVEGGRVRYLQPDERSTALLIKKALERCPDVGEAESTPGIFVSRRGFEDVLRELAKLGDLLYLHEEGVDIRKISINSDLVVFVLGDHLGIGRRGEMILEELGARRVSLGPLPIHADHCIAIVNNELDRREFGWGSR